MKKLVDENQNNWHKKMYEALWVDRITPKKEIRMPSFELVYKIGSVLPLPLELSSIKLQTTIEDQEFQNFLEKRIMYLTNIKEQGEDVVDKITIHHARVKIFLLGNLDLESS